MRCRAPPGKDSATPVPLGAAQRVAPLTGAPRHSRCARREIGTLARPGAGRAARGAPLRLSAEEAARGRVRTAHLHAVTQAELGEDAADVRLHRGLAHELARGDLGVAQAGGDGRENVALALAEGAERLLARRIALDGRMRWASIHVRQQVGDRPRSDDRVTAVDRADGREQELGLGVLQQESARARADRAQRRVVEIEGREHDDAGHAAARLLGGAQDARRARDAVGPGHPDVHEHHVGPLLGGDEHRLRSVAGLADDGEVELRVDEHAHAASEQRLVIDEEHADRVAHRDSPQGSAAARSPGRGGTSTMLTCTASDDGRVGAVMRAPPSAHRPRRRSRTVPWRALGS